jgi:hypothetical protein
VNSLASLGAEVGSETYFGLVADSVADDRGCRVDCAFGFADEALDGHQFSRAEGAELVVQVCDLLPGKTELPGQRRPHGSGDAAVDFEAGDALTQGGEAGLQRRFGGREGEGVHMVLWLQ